MIAVTPDDVLQIVPIIPSVRRPPLLSLAILRIWSWTSVSISYGATRASIAVMASSSPSTGMKLMSATTKSSAGKRARKK